MRIILSRKGMDSGAGGMASPILPDGTLLSLPIPENEDVKDADSTYDDIEYKGIKYSKIVRDLEEGERDKENLVKKPECTKCHIDPDLINRYTDFPSREGWKAAFGQHGKWQKHLEDYGIGKGDIFLFYG